MSEELDFNTDIFLVNQVKQGDRKSFSVLVMRHQRGLLGLCLRFVKDSDSAKDIVQESFIKAYQKLNLFECRSSFKSWLYQIAVNTARNKLREKRSNHVDIQNVQLAVLPTAEASLVQVAVADILQTEVDKLPFKQKTALVLRVYEDLSFQEIAHIMECPYDTAKANYRHALLRLRESFDQNSDLKNWSQQITSVFTDLHCYVEAEG